MRWLREQVKQRLETAKEACHGGEGNWWRRLRDLYVDGEPVPAGALFEGEPEVDDPESGVFLAEIVVYDEGRPSDEQFAHIALNDPQDVIARCEAELAILDACVRGIRSGRALLAEEIRSLVASGYRHRPGYAEHWGGVNEVNQPRV